jgi:hypothetical protein
MNSRAPLLLLWMRLMLASFLFAALTRTVPDAEPWGHVLSGRDVVRLGAIPSSEAYSFTSDIPWINRNWLAEAETS